jgi:hypothetical protein
MAETREHGGNGREHHESARRRLLDDTRVLSGDLQEALDETRASLRRQLEQSPYLTLAAGAIAGYVLGGGLASRLTRTAFGAGFRVAAAVFARELLSGVAREPSESGFTGGDES